MQDLRFGGNRASKCFATICCCIALVTHHYWSGFPISASVWAWKCATYVGFKPLPGMRVWSSLALGSSFCTLLACLGVVSGNWEPTAKAIGRSILGYQGRLESACFPVVSPWRLSHVHLSYQVLDRPCSFNIAVTKVALHKPHRGRGRHVAWCIAPTGVWAAWCRRSDYTYLLMLVLDSMRLCM